MIERVELNDAADRLEQAGIALSDVLECQKRFLTGAQPYSELNTIYAKREPPCWGPLFT